MEKIFSDEIQDFKQNAKNYINAISALAKVLLDAIAKVENFGDAFDRIMPGHRSFLRINYYPKRNEAHAYGSDPGKDFFIVDVHIFTEVWL